MSVILDALKRVQDENRRRDTAPGHEPEAPPVDTRGAEPPSNALLRRPSEPETRTEKRPSSWTVSPVIWVSAALVTLGLLVTAGLTWFQPTFDGPTVNDGQPLLARGGIVGGAPPAGVPTLEVQERLAPRETPGVRAAFAEGVRKHKAGDLHGASVAYERALDADPGNARVNANLGVLYEAMGQFPRAERHLRDAVESEPENAAAHNNLGVVLYRQGKYDAALIEFSRTLQLDPRHLEASTNKGLIFTRWGQLEDAERAFRQVLAIDSSHALAHYNLGLVHEEAGRYGAAIDAYHEFLKFGGMEDPEITDYLDRHLGWLERRRGRTSTPGPERLLHR